jgi:hypothetical protein
MAFIVGADDALIVRQDTDPAVMESFCSDVKHKELEGQALEPPNVSPWALPARLKPPSIPSVTPYQSDAPVSGRIHTDPEVQEFAVWS